eukprot:2516213-Pyramimonas_sp.AAC.1
MAYTDFFHWKDDNYFLPRGPIFCPGMPPKGQRLRSADEGVQNDEHMRTAFGRVAKGSAGQGTEWLSRFGGWFGLERRSRPGSRHAAGRPS